MSNVFLDVQLIAAQVNERKARLYQPNGQPLYAEPVMREKLAEIARFEQDELKKSIEDFDEQAREAEAELAESNSPYSWLRGDEWTQAAAMSAFIASDLARLTDASAVAKYAEEAMNTGRVPGWLARYHAQQRLADIPHQSIFTAEAEKAVATMADRLRPATDQARRQDAEKRLKEAQQAIKAAERVLGAEQQENRLGVAGMAKYIRQEAGFTE